MQVKYGRCIFHLHYKLVGVGTKTSCAIPEEFSSARTRTHACNACVRRIRTNGRRFKPAVTREIDDRHGFTGHDRGMEGRQD